MDQSAFTAWASRRLRALALPLIRNGAIMSSENAEYYRKRAADERDLAKAAPSEIIAKIHLDLAEQYEVLAALPDVPPGLRGAD